MNRRNFIRGALTAAAIVPVVLAAKADESEEFQDIGVINYNQWLEDNYHGREPVEYNDIPPTEEEKFRDEGVAAWEGYLDDSSLTKVEQIAWQECVESFEANNVFAIGNINDKSGTVYAIGNVNDKSGIIYP